MAESSDNPIIRAAVLASTGYTIPTVAKALQRSQSTVRRYLRQAKDAKYLEDRPQLNPEHINREDLEAANVWFLEWEASRIGTGRQLIESFDLRSAVVVPMPAQSGLSNPWQYRLDVLGRAAAARVARLLPKILKVGVLWGRSLRSLVSHLDVMPSQKQIQVFPLTGEPIFIEFASKPYPVELTSSSIARDLGTRLSQNVGPQLSLAPVPSFLPAKFTRGVRGNERPQKLQLLLDLFVEVPAYRKIFGTTAPPEGEPHARGEVTNLDTVLTSVGVVNPDDPFYHSLYRTQRARSERWSRLIFGDMGGVLFPQPSIDSKGRRAVREMAARSTGINKYDFLRIAERSRESKGKCPGVIVIAQGATKAPVLAQAIRERCVNEIVVDDSLAERLLELARTEPMGLAAGRRE
jgi:DNA-binding transcriptional regulator LsrR (DeoR family)